MLNVKNKNIVFACMFFGCAVSMPPKLDPACNGLGFQAQAAQTLLQRSGPPLVVTSVCGLPIEPRTNSAVRKSLAEWATILRYKYKNLLEEKETKEIVEEFELSVKEKLQTRIYDLSTLVGLNDFLGWIEQITIGPFEKKPEIYPLLLMAVMAVMAQSNGRIMASIKDWMAKLALHAKCPVTELRSLLKEIEFTEEDMQRQVRRLMRLDFGAIAIANGFGEGSLTASPGLIIKAPSNDASISTSEGPMPQLEA